MASKLKRIGYIDHRLENFHANVYLGILRKELKDRGFVIAGCMSEDEAEGRIWAKKNDVPYYSTPAELAANVDYFMVLAPSNPERHLDLCKMVFPFGKTTYVDKTFAPDLKSAKAIFKLGDKHGVKLQTSSALRYTNVQDQLAELGGQSAIQHMVAWGGGRSFEEYGIHPMELVVSCMGSDIASLMRRGTGPCSQVLINFKNGRTAVVNVYTDANTPFAASVSTAKETRLITVDGSKIFINMAAAILDLFEKGKPNIPRAESLAIRQILDAAADPAALKNFIKLK
ncbi:MAG: hypothetical protein A2X49_14935 [Lentisphaerae bacterium GWF2_52_8]|nr:MAG: hypothetical protein A2X49_14935 [Lentisphaerae bacterium GWF2_52_8]